MSANFKIDSDESYPYNFRNSSDSSDLHNSKNHSDESDSEGVKESWTDFPFHHWHDDILLYTLDDSAVIEQWVADHRSSCPSSNPLCSRAVSFREDRCKELRNLTLDGITSGNFTTLLYLLIIFLLLLLATSLILLLSIQCRLLEVVPRFIPPPDEDWENDNFDY